MGKQKLDLVHLSVDNINGIKQEIAELENMLKSDKASGSPKIQNEVEFRAEINSKKKLLKDHAPEELKGQAQNKAFKRVHELKEIIQDAMPSNKEYYQPYPKDGSTHDFERVVKQQMAFQSDKNMQNAVQEYKHLMRRIDPQDPTITNVELLRK